jgi:LuxR family transcriptional regulator, quorum-sensing system regulator CciR
MNAPLVPPSVAPNASGRRRRLRPILTSRQRDCLILVARGKNDRQIAEALGISGQTVHKHIEAAKKRYGVSTRMQLVMQALFISYVDLGEIMERA